MASLLVQVFAADSAVAPKPAEEKFSSPLSSALAGLFSADDMWQRNGLLPAE